MPAPMSEDDDDVLNATVTEPSNNPKRSRKLVTKAYMDKDGFVGMVLQTFSSLSFHHLLSISFSYETRV